MSERTPNMSHTEGPWIIEEPLDPLSTHSIRGPDNSDGTRAYVCAIILTGFSGSDSSEFLEQNAAAKITTQANANLIAAAPNMEQALLFVKAFFRRLENGVDEDDPITVMRRKFHAPVHAAVDAALKKANGES